jgi:LytS/YehU family sensor histidine kinase
LAVAGYLTENTYRYYRPRGRNVIQQVGWSIALSIICTLLFQYLLSQLFANRPDYLQFLNLSLPLRYLFSLLMIAFITVVSWLWFYSKEQEENQKRKDEAERLSRESELNRLHQQLQPHFLFNSLNSISSLAGTNPEQAREMIQQLSDFLRGTLKKDDKQLVNLADELNLLDLYLRIEKVRFGYRLNTHLINEPETLTMKLPSLLLQPLVENAIKFGLYDTIGEITISIISRSEANNLVIEIKNPFDSLTSKPKRGTGFGLSSVQRRLHILYARQDLLHTEQKDNFFITTLKIPQLS